MDNKEELDISLLLPKETERNKYYQWKKKQKEEISNQGENEKLELEDEYISRMLERNLNAYICYMEVDAYTRCLKEKKLIESEPSFSDLVINTKQNLHQRLCSSTFKAYEKCMKAADNQMVLMEQAIAESHCEPARVLLHHCMHDKKQLSEQSMKMLCEREYKRLIRCGLNHLWNRYWRSLANIGEMEEFQAFKTETDISRQMYYEHFRQKTANLNAFNEQ